MAGALLMVAAFVASRCHRSWLSRLCEDPAGALSTPISDDEVHSLAVLALAESMDQWLIRGFPNNGDAVFLAQSSRITSLRDQC